MKNTNYVVAFAKYKQITIKKFFSFLFVYFVSLQFIICIVSL